MTDQVPPRRASLRLPEPAEGNTLGEFPSLFSPDPLNLEASLVPSHVGGSSTASPGSVISGTSGMSSFVNAGGSRSGNAKLCKLIFTSALGNGEVNMRCCGKIGQSNKFCWSEDADCEVTSHEVNKVDIPPGHFFVAVGSDDLKGYCEPCMARSLLRDSESLEQVLEQEKTREEWTALFSDRKAGTTPSAKVKREAFGAKSPHSDLARTVVMRIDEELPGFTSPGVVKRAPPGPSLMNPEAASSPGQDPAVSEDAGYEKVSDPLVRGHLRSHGYNITKVVAEASANRKTLDSLATLEGQVRASISDSTLGVAELRLKLGETQSNLESDSRDLQLKIGMPSGTSNLGAFPVWGALDFLDQATTQNASSLQSVSRQVTQLINHFNGLIQDQHLTILELRRDMTSLKVGGPLLASQPPPGGLANPVLRQAHDAFQVSTEYKALVNDIDGIKTSLSTLEQGDYNLGPALDQRLTSLEKEHGMLKTQIEGSGTFTFQGKVFSSPSDVLRIIGGADLEACSVSWFVDVCTVVCNAIEKHTTGYDFIRQIKSAKEHSNGTFLEVEAMVTMGSDAPLFMFEKKSGSSQYVDADDGFGCRFESYEKFAGVNHVSQKEILIENCDKFISGVAGIIHGHSFAAQLAHHMGQEVSMQIQNQLSYAERWHNELVHQCNYDSKVGWKFVGVSFRSMYTEMSKARAKISKLEDWTTPENKALIIWTAMCTHAKMKEFIKFGYKSHPVVTTAMSNFLMKTRVDSSQVEALDTKVKALLTSEKKVSTLENEFKAFKSLTTGDIKTLKARK